MARIRLRYVQAFVDRHGHARHYFRRHGIRQPLPGLPGSADFMAAYAAALSEEPISVDRRPTAKPGTFAALAAAYYGSAQYRGLSFSSRRNYRRVIDGFVTEHGHRRVDQLRRDKVVTLVGGMSDRPGAAIILLKRIRTLCRFAIDLGWIDVDPTARVRSYTSREIHTWTEDEIAQFERRWPIGTTQRLAFAILLYTGQRGSDVHRMTWPDVAGEAIRVVQQKTGAKLTIALHVHLQAVLAVAKRSEAAIIVTEYGNAFSVKGFGLFMSAALKAAGLPPRCKAHGLRKAAARRLAEAGCTANEIASVTGHKTLAEVERYTREADQKRLSAQAIRKQSENTALSNRTASTVKPPRRSKELRHSQ
jgi:integrase